MNTVTVDPRRTCKATPFDWPAADYPDAGEPGQACQLHERLLQFACPGCGRFGAIRCGSPKPGESPSWVIAAGSLADPTTLTLTPSINCVGCCGWHGYLTAGEFKSC